MRTSQAFRAAAFVRAALLLSPLLGTLTVSGAAVTYDLASDFSLRANPNGVWTYGALAVPGRLLAPFGVKGVTTDERGVSVEYWQIAPGVEPTLCHNGTGSTSTANNGQCIFPPGTVWLLPPADDAPYTFGVVRFTAPAGQTGLYRLETSVRACFHGPNGGDSDFHVTTNGVEVFSAQIGFWFGLVLDARMSVMTYAAWGETTTSPAGGT